MLLFAAARAAFACRKVKLKATQQAEACYFLGVGYGDAVKAAIIAEQLLIQLLLPAVMLSKAPACSSALSHRNVCSASSTSEHPETAVVGWLQACITQLSRDGGDTF